MFMDQVPEKFYIPILMATATSLYCKNISWITYWSDVIQFGVIWINVNQVGILVIPNYRMFALNLFNFKIISALSIFKNIVASRVFTFNFCCAMPWQAPVGEFQNPSNRVEDITVARTVILWGYGSNGSLRDHPSAVINISPRSSASDISTLTQTPEGGGSPYHCVTLRSLCF